jgi:hypothetical protein
MFFRHWYIQQQQQWVYQLLNDVFLVIFDVVQVWQLQHEDFVHDPFKDNNYDLFKLI